MPSVFRRSQLRFLRVVSISFHPFLILLVICCMLFGLSAWHSHRYCSPYKDMYAVMFYKQKSIITSWKENKPSLTSPCNALEDHEAADAPASANFPPLPVANATTTTISGESHIHNSSLPLLVGRDHRQAVLRRGKVVLAALYAIQVFYSFFIM